MSELFLLDSDRVGKKKQRRCEIVLFLKCVWEVSWHFEKPFRPRPVHCPNVWELCCLTWHALLSLPCFPPWQVELSIQRGCMTHVWTPSTAFPWLHLWTSSSCVYTEDCLQKSQILTTSGKYVWFQTIFSLISWSYGVFCVCVCVQHQVAVNGFKNTHHLLKIGASCPPRVFSAFIQS